MDTFLVNPCREDGSPTSQCYKLYLDIGKYRTLVASNFARREIVYPDPNGNTEVSGGMFEHRGVSYYASIPDGRYTIRTLSVRECERLQTLPDGYTKAMSKAQAYKAIGNGWTAEAVIHIMRQGMRGIPRETKIICLSLYDGIATARYCLSKLGFQDVDYYAFEIDKFAIKCALDNWPDIVELGDAFQVREEGFGAEWLIGKKRELMNKEN